MGTKAHPWRDGKLVMYDPSEDYETMSFQKGIAFLEDFCGAFTAIPAGGSEESGCLWSKKIVGAAPPTVAVVADAAGGIVQCALTNDDQKQDAALYMGDQRQFDLSKDLMIEWRVKVSVTPTLVAEAYWGLFDNWADGEVDAATYMICFTADGSTSIYCESDDNTSDLSADSGVDAGTSDWKVYRIEIFDTTDIHFYIDGVRVASSTTFSFAATGANAILQPMFGLYKASGAGVGTIQVDYVKIWADRE